MWTAENEKRMRADIAASEQIAREQGIPPRRVTLTYEDAAAALAEIDRLTGERVELLANLGTGKVWVCPTCTAVSPAAPGYEIGISEPCALCGEGIARVVMGRHEGTKNERDALFDAASKFALAVRYQTPALPAARPRSRPYVAEQRQRDRSPVYAEFEKMGQLESDVIEWLSANYEPLKRRALEASRAARASRGETGPAAEPTRAERVAEAQRLRAEARAEAEACAVPMPADLLARYPRSADPPEPDRPSGLTSIMHDAAQRQSVLPKHGGPEL